MKVLLETNGYKPFVKLIVIKLDQSERNLTAEFTAVAMLPSGKEYEKAKD